MAAHRKFASREAAIAEGRVREYDELEHKRQHRNVLKARNERRLNSSDWIKKIYKRRRGQ